MFRALTFDGGGIRGLLSVAILRRLLDSFPKLIYNTELLVGTSTGSFIALGLAADAPLDMLYMLYLKAGKRVFKRDWRHPFAFMGARYHNDSLAEVLRELLGEKTRLRDLKRRVLIPAFDLQGRRAGGGTSGWRPKFFNSMQPSDMDLLCWKVALYSSAAPTYFPAVDGYIDGGVVANNPSRAAVSAALSDGVKLDDIRVLSIGTGETVHREKNPDYDFGAKDVRTLVDILIGGSEQVADYQCRNLLAGHYCRINPLLLEEIELDDVSAVAKLNYIADQVNLSPVGSWLGVNWGL
jgi:patatin-like phospholipase/acyl hydrolase